MPHFTLPIVADGLILNVMIGLTGRDTVSRLSTGKPIPAPVLLRSAIDTGTDITCVNAQFLKGLGLTFVQQLSSTTVAGVIPVDLFDISFSIPPTGRLTAPLLVLEQLRVMELVHSTPGIDVLVGRDVMHELLMISDGPRDEFTLGD
jgi:hypothetical protein